MDFFRRFPETNTRTKVGADPASTALDRVYRDTAIVIVSGVVGFAIFGIVGLAAFAGGSYAIVRYAEREGSKG